MIAGLLASSVPIKGTGGGQRSKKFISLISTYFKIWNTRVQELFTEFKKLARRLHTTSAKLGPKCVFCGIMPFLYGKFGGKKQVFLTLFLSSFPLFQLDTQFFGYDQPKGGQKNCWSRIFHFSRFFGFLGHFFPKFLKKRDFSPKKVPKIRKNAKNEKSATNNFFGLLWATHSQKTGHQGSNMENQIGKTCEKNSHFQFL